MWNNFGVEKPQLHLLQPMKPDEQRNAENQQNDVVEDHWNYQPNYSSSSSTFFNSTPALPPVPVNDDYVPEWQSTIPNFELVQPRYDSFHQSFAFEQCSAVEKLKSDFSISQQEFNAKLDSLKEESRKKLEKTEKEVQKYQIRIKNLKTTVDRLANLVLKKTENEKKFKTTVKLDKEWQKVFYFPHDEEKAIEIDLEESLRSCIYANGLTIKDGCREYLRHVLSQCIPDVKERVKYSFSDSPKKTQFVFPYDFLDSVVQICFAACGGNLKKNYQKLKGSKMSKNERLFLIIQSNVIIAGEFLLSADRKMIIKTNSTKMPKKGILKKTLTEKS
uniref:Uncharacterized protein n=1 Tax=Panagrolaimus sp. JU765 TaxID=591449 RepID=A0AC34RNE4_9BILA